MTAVVAEAVRGRDPARTRSSLDPRAVVAWSAAALAVTLLTANPIYRGLVALAALAVLQAWLLPGRRLRPMVVAAVVAAGIAVAVNVVASHGGSHELVRIPDAIPVLGGPVTLESLAYGGAIGLGLAAALLAIAPLSLALETHDLVAVVPPPLERTGIALAAALNLVSGIGRTFGAVRDAQRMRGWTPGRVRSWNAVIVPVVLTAIEDSVLLAESMEARGFGARGRTAYAELAWSSRDAAVVAIAACVPLLFLVFRVAGVDTEWYPYPSFAMPPAQPLLAIGCAALALPAALPQLRAAR